MISLKTLVMESMSIAKAFKGTSRGGAPILTVVDGFRVYKGSNIYTSRLSLPIYTVVGDKLFTADKIGGSPLANLSGNKIFKGHNVYGIPLATIKGEVAFKGNDVGGLPMVTSPGGSPHAIMAAVYHVLFG